MAQVIFKFDKEKDLHNIWETCNFSSDWFDFKKTINPAVLKIAENKEFEECKQEIEQHFESIYNSGLIEIFVDALNKSWNNINNEFFKRLENIMKKPIVAEEFTGYLTLMGRCPYNIKENWFMTSFFRPLPQSLITAAHEIMHLQFHHHFWKDIEAKITKEKTDDLKEALTVLLNLEFKDLFFVEDRGYEPHKELRGFISNEWKKHKDFDKLLEKCVEFPILEKFKRSLEDVKAGRIRRVA